MPCLVSLTLDVSGFWLRCLPHLPWTYGMWVLMKRCLGGCHIVAKCVSLNFHVSIFIGLDGTAIYTSFLASVVRHNNSSSSSCMIIDECILCTYLDFELLIFFVLLRNYSPILCIILLLGKTQLFDLKLKEMSEIQV